MKVFLLIFGLVASSFASPAAKLSDYAFTKIKGGAMDSDFHGKVKVRDFEME